MALKGEKDSGLEKRSQLDKVTNEELVMHNGQVAFDLKSLGVRRSTRSSSSNKYLMEGLCELKHFLSVILFLI